MDRQSGCLLPVPSHPSSCAVVQKPDGTFDALGLALDVPGADEEITVYVLHEQQGSAHLSYTDARGRRCGRWEACASYRLHSTQPEDATARDNFAWRKSVRGAGPGHADERNDSMNDFDLSGFAVSAAELADLVQSQVETVRSILADGDHTNFMPALFVLARDAEKETTERLLFALAVPFNENHEKKAAMRRIGRQLYADQRFPVAAALTTECWRASNPPPHTRPADCPDRQEGIVVQAATLDRQHRAMQMIEVTRNAADAMVLGATQPLVTEATAKLETRLLDQLFFGFFEETAARAGIPLPS